MALFGNSKNDEELKLLREKVQLLEQNAKLAKEKPEEFDTPLEVLFSWRSPSRVFVARGKEWFLKVEDDHRISKFLQGIPLINYCFFRLFQLMHRFG